MPTFNRRQWLKTAGLTSALSVFQGVQAFPITDFSDTPSASDGQIYLASNENPFGPSEKVRQAMIQGFEKACRYPWRYADELLQMIADREQVSTDHIVLTAGSTEGLRLSGLTFGVRGGEIITAQPTFKALLTYAQQFGAYINHVPLDKELKHDLDEMERRVTNNTQLIFICNPNNPTGTIVDGEHLRKFCQSVSRTAVVFSDEAYFDFITQPGYPSMVELVKEGMNVIVSRTFSKVYGLAGIRIGYLIARPDLAQRLRQNAMAGMNIMGIYAATAALKDREFYQFSLRKNEEAKKHIYTTLGELGLKYVPSFTNFVFFETGRPIKQVIDGMMELGVRVGRPFPPYDTWCRISTGKMEDVVAFGNALRSFMS